MGLIIAIIATLSIWDYPARQPRHEQLRYQFMGALHRGDAKAMEATCLKGVELLPEDPTWHYNLACSIAHFKGREKNAFDELEKAIDLGFRDAEAIEKDADLRQLNSHRRYDELIEYAKEMRSRPLMFGPLACVDATGVFGKPIALGEQNLGWNFDFGCFVARMKLESGGAGGNFGDLYMNRDGAHSMLDATGFPGLTVVRFDQAGRDRGLDLNAPNVMFPYPVFGNSSRAFTHEVYWRSLPRALMTIEPHSIKRMMKFYLSNQVWVFPANADIAPVGTNGDVFASIAPYWITTAGKSFSDIPYLKAALEASRHFGDETKREIVRRSLLAPTIQTLIRKSLIGVDDENAYLGAKAHPTAFPADAVRIDRLVGMAAAMKPEEVPPLASLLITAAPVKMQGKRPELTYASAFAWAFVLRAEDERREFFIRATGAKEFAFAVTHGAEGAATIERIGTDAAKVTLRRDAITPVARVDVAVFGRNPGTGWGAPSYVSFARMDASAPYSDPALTSTPDSAK